MTSDPHSALAHRNVDPSLSGRFLAALAMGDISVAYQRIVELPTLRTVKVEALARWDDPVHGRISPEVFVAIAEQCGLVSTLDLHVARRACTALAAWRSNDWPDLAVSINCSPLTLSEPGFVQRLLDTISMSGVPTSAVWVEVTESTLVGHEARETIAELARHGLRVALDDFGTGFASMSNLRHFAVHALKIDRSFVTHADEDPKAIAMIRSIVGLGHELGHAVVAEGVETEREEQVLRRLGVTLLQGFRYSIPAEAGAVLVHKKQLAMPTPLVVPAPMPEHEEERVAALLDCHVLDTEPETIFDTLTRIAADVCGVPIALITMIDGHRQWFKSKIGIDIAETTREVSFCSHTILRPAPMIIENMLEDERFARNPFVLGAPDIRFYGGVPLITSEGHALGTLCVLDSRPRQLDASQQKLLVSLADQVVAHLEQRAMSARLDAAVGAKQVAESTIRFHVTHDQLTGLANRRRCIDELTARLLTGPTSLVSVDLDAFSEINEVYGQTTGDQLLAHVARALRATVRLEDLAARVDGDQFAIVVSTGDPHMLDKLTARLRSAVRQPSNINRQIIIPEVSIGIAVHRRDDDAESLMRRADEDLDRDRRSRPHPLPDAAPVVGHAHRLRIRRDRIGGLRRICTTRAAGRSDPLDTVVA